jgi:hypothetical protein
MIAVHGLNLGNRSKSGQTSDDFLAIKPTVERHAAFAFRHLGSTEREEAIAETRLDSLHFDPCLGRTAASRLISDQNASKPMSRRLAFRSPRSECQRLHLEFTASASSLISGQNTS